MPYVMVGEHSIGIKVLISFVFKIIAPSIKTGYIICDESCIDILNITEKSTKINHSLESKLQTFILFIATPTTCPPTW